MGSKKCGLGEGHTPEILGGKRNKRGPRSLKKGQSKRREKAKRRQKRGRKATGSQEKSIRLDSELFAKPGAGVMGTR